LADYNSAMPPFFKFNAEAFEIQTLNERHSLRQDPLRAPLLHMFDENICSRLERLKILLAACDFVESSKIIHTIKGSSAMYGFNALHEVSVQVENDIRQLIESPSAEKAARLNAEIESLSIVCKRTFHSVA
jgi:HPt (histidine-containing phosphotransfer) domain-containing protein